MSEIKSHKDLKVWQEAMDLVIDIYRLASNFPPEEKIQSDFSNKKKCYICSFQYS